MLDNARPRNIRHGHSTTGRSCLTMERLAATGATFTRPDVTGPALPASPFLGKPDLSRTGTVKHLLASHRIAKQQQHDFQISQFGDGLHHALLALFDKFQLTLDSDAQKPEVLCPLVSVEPIEDQRFS